VIQDYDVNIIRINTYWTEDDVERNLCGRSRRRMKENHVHISCTSDDKKKLQEQSKVTLEFIEDNG
jgi:CDP-diacylglycerol pyrophosphatase